MFNSFFGKCQVFKNLKKLFWNLSFNYKMRNVTQVCSRI
jgi:hypothetical protein